MQKFILKTGEKEFVHPKTKINNK